MTRNKERFRELLAECTFDGLNLVAHSETVVCKVFWSSTFATTFIGSVFVCSACFINYSAYPTLVVTSLNYGNVKFPAVTFCNLNAISNSKLPQTGSAVGSLINVVNAAQSSNAKRRKKRQGVLSCPPGWIVVGNFCYNIIVGAADYSTAKLTCINAKSRLPIFNSFSDFMKFSKIFQNTTFDSMEESSSTPIQAYVGASLVSTKWLWTNYGSNISQQILFDPSLINITKCLAIQNFSNQLTEAACARQAQATVCQRWRSDVPQSCSKIHRAFSMHNITNGGQVPVHRFTLYPNYKGFTNEDAMYSTYAFEHDIETLTEPVYILTNPSFDGEPVYGFRDNFKNQNVSAWSNPYDIAFYVPKFTIINQTSEYKLLYRSSPAASDSLFCQDPECANIYPWRYQCQAVVPFFNSVEMCSNYSLNSYTTTTELSVCNVKTTAAITTSTTILATQESSAVTSPTLTLTSSSSSTSSSTTTITTGPAIVSLASSSLFKVVSSTAPASVSAPISTSFPYFFSSSSSSSLSLSSSFPHPTQRLESLLSSPFVSAVTATVLPALPLTASSTSGLPDSSNDQSVENLLQSSYTGISDPFALTTTAQEDLIYLTGQMNESYRSSIGYSLDELLQLCTYSKQPCQTKLFQQTYDPTYGNCYSYTPDSYTVMRAGSEEGLKITVSINQSDYLPISTSTGLRVVIHDNDSPAFPDIEGYNLSPGKLFSFSISKDTKTKLSAPYGNCQSTLGNVSYTVEGCLRACEQKFTIKMCGCGQPTLPQTDDQMTVCDIFKKDCVAQAETAFDPVSCSCSPVCKESVFSTVVTSANLNSESAKIFCYPKNDEECRQNLRKTTVYFEVYYSKLSSTTYAEVASYDAFQLLYDLANYSGLLFGISIMSLFEIIPLIILLFCILFSYFKSCVTPYHSAKRYSFSSGFSADVHYIN